MVVLSLLFQCQGGKQSSNWKHTTILVLCTSRSASFRSLISRHQEFHASRASIWFVKDSNGPSSLSWILRQMTVWSLMLSLVQESIALCHYVPWPCKHAQEICSNGCFGGGGGPGLKLVVSGFQFLTLPSIEEKDDNATSPWCKIWITTTTPKSNMVCFHNARRHFSSFFCFSSCPLFFAILDSAWTSETIYIDSTSIYIIHFMISLDIQTATSRGSVFIEPPQKKGCPENTQNETTRNRQFHPLKRPGSKACFIHLLQ